MKLFFILLFITNSIQGNSQLTPIDSLHHRGIAGDSTLIIQDSMIITKYQCYIGPGYYNYARCGVNWPSNLRTYIKGFEFADSIKLQDVRARIDVRITDTSYKAQGFTLAVVKPKNRLESFIHTVSFTHILTDTKILNQIKVGDIIAVLCVTGVNAQNRKLCDLQSTIYKVVE